MKNKHQVRGSNGDLHADKIVDVSLHISALCIVSRHIIHGISSFHPELYRKHPFQQKKRPLSRFVARHLRTFAQKYNNSSHMVSQEKSKFVQTFCNIN